MPLLSCAKKFLFSPPRRKNPDRSARLKIYYYMNFFPSRHTSTAPPHRGLASAPLVCVDHVLDARQPDRLTVPPTVPAVRASIFN